MPRKTKAQMLEDAKPEKADNAAGTFFEDTDSIGDPIPEKAALPKGKASYAKTKAAAPKIVQLLAAPTGMVKTVTDEAAGTGDDIPVVCIGLLDNGKTVKLTAEDVGDNC